MGRLKGVSNRGNSFLRSKESKLQLLKNKLTKKYGENYASVILEQKIKKAQHLHVQRLTNQSSRAQN